MVAGGSTIWRDEMTQTARKFPFQVQKRPAIEVDPSMLAVEHGVEPSGIDQAIKRDRRGRQVSDWSQS